jgi:hypothetical protein
LLTLATQPLEMCKSEMLLKLSLGGAALASNSERRQQFRLQGSKLLGAIALLIELVLAT